MENALAAAARSLNGQSLSDTELARLELPGRRVRDMLYALPSAKCGRVIVGVTGAGAARAVAGGGPGVAVQRPARGDGPLASVRCRLRCAVVGHRMAGMLDTALRSGLRPEHIRDIAVTSTNR